MRKQKLWFFGSLIVLLTVIVLLLTASNLLTFSLSDDPYIPLGTFITWAGIIAFPLTIYWGMDNWRKPVGRAERILSSLLKFQIVLATLWLPICFALSGNMAFTFVEKENFQGGQSAMRLFWYFNYFMGVAPLFLLLAYWFKWFFSRRETQSGK